MRRRRFLKCTSVCAGSFAAGLRPVCGQDGPKDLREAVPIGYASAPKPLPTTSEVIVRDPSAIKILQFTDIHFYCDRERYGDERDRRTFEDLRKLTDRHDPDLLAVTGDLWHDNPDGRGQAYFEEALEKIVSLGKPWLFTWGNHDLLDDYAAAQVRLTEARNSLYRGGRDAGNYVVSLVSSARETVWECVCLNTTTQGVQEKEEAWLDALAASRHEKMRPKGAFCMLHIPLMEYETVWQRNSAHGTHGEEVCTYGEDGSAFGHLAAFGNIRACFCGHDHVNDYGGSWKGIELVYGRATGYGGYGGDRLPKGGKLIRLNAEAGQYTWKSVFADGTEWSPGRD